MGTALRQRGQKQHTGGFVIEALVNIGLQTIPSTCFQTTKKEYILTSPSPRGLSFRMSSCLVITKALRKPNYLDARIIVRSVGTADTLCSSANSKTGSKELSKVDCYDVCGECG